jgi:hypothetical protein
VNNIGFIEGFISSGTAPAPQDGYWLLERSDENPLPHGATFYDAESNSILFMKEVEENGDFITVIDNDKEPIFL